MADSDRYSMQCLADIVKYALNHNVINKDDLYDTETNVIKMIEECGASRLGTSSGVAIVNGAKADPNSY